jgi:linoleoyl-CoA desaturase
MGQNTNSHHTPPKFAHRKQTDFYATLRQRVNQYFTDNKIDKTGDWRLYLKSIIFLTVYITSYVAIYGLQLSFGYALSLYLLMGIAMSGIGFCIMHDAIHGSYSKIGWVNKLMGNTLTLVGGNPATWEIQHNVLHHTYTNVYGHDEDIHDKPFLRLSPDGKWTKIHRYQHFYAIFLYGMATLMWCSIKDIRQTINYDKDGFLEKIGVKKWNVLTEIIVAKIAYLSIFFVLPIIFGHFAWYQVLAGFLSMHFVAGVITTVVFQLAHVVEHTDYFQPDDANQLENSWAVHQLNTTANFAKNNHIINWFVGGLNFQIEHHLFSNISHVHYSKISPIVKATAIEFGIPYHEFDTLSDAISSHWQVLRQLGNNELVSIR